MPRSAITAEEYDIVSHDDAALSPEDVAKIREWLQPTDYLAESGEFRRHLLSQAPGTGLWISQTEEYRQWHDFPDRGSLWIKGVPGAGKSVIAASIVQHLRTTEQVPVLFFFFRNIVAANFSPRALIQDWLAQLLPHSSRLQLALQPRLRSQLDEISDNDLVDLFLDGLSAVPKVYCVADALDEMTLDNKSFLDKLNSLATYRPQSLKLLMTSRPKQYLQSALRDASIVHVSLQQKLVDLDIASYLTHRFDVTPKSDAQWTIKQAFVDMVAKRSEGLFLYAKLTMDQVESALLSDEPVNIAALEGSLPLGLEQTYNSVLAKQREQHGISTDIQVLILEAVTHASRPLRLNELANLLKCIYPTAAEPTGFKALISTACGPLVEILEDETLQVIHHSFTEFLRGDTRNESADGAPLDFPVIDSAQAHKRLTLNCLKYLQSGAMRLEGENLETNVTFRKPAHEIDPDEEHHKRSYLGIIEQGDPFDYRQARLLHPFLSYAVENWPHHAGRYDVYDEEFFDAISAFMKPNADFLRWLVLQWGSTSKNKTSYEGIPTALHLAAFCGLSELASKLVKEGASLSAHDAQERTPIHWAAWNGHAKLVSLLLTLGSDSNPEDALGFKPIHLAARTNRAEAVTVLLEAGVEPTTIKTKENHAGRLLGGETITKGETAILYVSQRGHEETAIAMIPFCKGEILEQLLCESCRFHRADVVLAILEQSDVSPDAMFAGATALYFACGAANVKCVEALIKRGADVNKTSIHAPRRARCGGMWGPGTEKAPVNHLIDIWHDRDNAECEAVLQMLVNAGADVDQVDGNGLTALLHAVGVNNRGSWPKRMRLGAVRALLKSGADITKGSPNARDRDDTVLHIFLENFHDLETVQLFMEHGADPNLKDGDGKTALHTVLGGNSMRLDPGHTTEIAKYLLEHGADPNMEDGRGKTPVQHAMTSSDEIFQLLLSNCKDHLVKRRCWFSLANVKNLSPSFEEHLKLLLAEGIDINTKAQDGGTLLLRCLTNEKHLSVLYRYGAQPDVVDNQGNNALHLLVGRGMRPDTMRKMVQPFIDKGVDPLAKKNNGDTLLHLMARTYNTEQRVADVVQWLLSFGIDVNAVNSDGQTALHVNLLSKPHCNVPCDPKHRSFVDAIKDGNTIDFSIRDKDGLAPIHLASLRSQNAVATLVEAGADLAFLTADSQNVLHLASRARQANIVGQVLSHAAADLDVNQKDDLGRTPLHYACASGEPASVAFLLEHGTHVNVNDDEKCSPLHACAAFRIEQNNWDVLGQRRRRWVGDGPGDPLRPDVQMDLCYREPWYMARYITPKLQSCQTMHYAVGTIAKMLLDAGADASVANKGKATALDVAISLGSSEFVEVFALNDQLYEKLEETLGRTNPDHAEMVKAQFKAQMELMCSKPSAKSLSPLSYDQILKDPSGFLNLLTCEDAVAVINEGLERHPQEGSHGRTLENLVTSDLLRVVEGVPKLIQQYSSYDSLKVALERSQKKEVQYKETEARTALQIACLNAEPNLQMLQLLVETMGVNVNEHCVVLKNNNQEEYGPGGTALHLLASGKNWWQLEGIKYLVSKGADVNAQDEKGQTPLHIAAAGMKWHGAEVGNFWKPAAVTILLDNGADPNILNNVGRSALHKASNAPGVMKELLRRGADVTVGDTNPLFLAIMDQNLETLEALLDHGVSPDLVDEERHSRDVHYTLTESCRVCPVLCSVFPIMNSQIENSVPLLQALVERGADLYMPLNDRENLIHFLFENPEYEALDALLQEPCISRIDFNRRDQQGRTVLMAACDWIEVLPGYFHRHWAPKATGPPLRILDAGADATLTDNEGRTALHHMLENTGLPLDVIEQFINRPEVAPTLFAKDNEGFTPLHLSLRTLRPEICELLLSKGADLLEPDPDGRTALHHLADQCFGSNRSPPKSGRLTIKLSDELFDQSLTLWRRFLAQGGSINAGDKDGNTPLHVYMTSEENFKMNEGDELCHIAQFDKLFPPDSGVDLFAVNDAGETMLHVIPGHGFAEHQEALFETMMGKGLDPLKEDAKGRSALDVASACDCSGIMALMVRK